MDMEERALNVVDVVDQESYIRLKNEMQQRLLDADSAVYEDLRQLIADQQASKGVGEEDAKEAEKKIKEYLKTHNEGKENNEYLVRGAELQCTCGSHTRKLNLNLCHGVYIKGHPVVHELDCFCGYKDNITWFGICKKENIEQPKIFLHDKDGNKLFGSKCHPQIVGTWLDSYEGTQIVDNWVKMEDDQGNPVGCNTLTVGSFLVCQQGGIIAPVNSGQDREVKPEEFKEGHDAYKRVMGIKEEKDASIPNNEQTLKELSENKHRLN